VSLRMQALIFFSYFFSAQPLLMQPPLTFLMLPFFFNAFFGCLCSPPHIFLMLPFFFSQALRMQPPLIFLMREVLEDREYKGMTIPKGDKVFLSPSLAGRR
jgi:hypothetical protein